MCVRVRSFKCLRACFVRRRVPTDALLQLLKIYRHSTGLLSVMFAGVLIRVDLCVACAHSRIIVSAYTCIQLCVCVRMTATAMWH